MKNQLDADTLITGTGIAARIIGECPDLDEAKIDDALADTYTEGISAQAWETQTRLALGINPFWADNEEGPRRRKEDRS